MAKLLFGQTLLTHSIDSDLRIAFGKPSLTVGYNVEYSTFIDIIQSDIGVTDDFLGSDLDGSDQITITHGLGKSAPFFILYADNEMVQPANYTISVSSSNSFVLTVGIPYNAGTNFNYRVL